MNYNWDFLVLFRPSVTGEGFYWQLMLSGLGWTVLLSLVAWVLALALAVVLGVARSLPFLPGRWFSATFVHCFRNVPLLVQVFLWFFVFPELLPERWGMAIKELNPTLNQFLTLLIALSLYSAAKAAELIRAGINSIPKGQMQAAQALGLGLTTTYRDVILPQVFRIILPPLTSDFLSVFKNSAVALTIGLMELTGRARQISEFSSQPFETFIAATVLYVLISIAVIYFMRWLENKTRVPGYLNS